MIKNRNILFQVFTRPWCNINVEIFLQSYKLFSLIISFQGKSHFFTEKYVGHKRDVERGRSQ